MDDTVEIVLGLIVSVIVFFIFPIYVGYEKKDDLSYALATKYVSDFVEDVKVKGYISTRMYQDLEDKLATTGNTYDIFMEHKANKIYPYVENGKNVEGKFMELQEIYTEKQILDVIGKKYDDGTYSTNFASKDNKISLYSAEKINSDYGINLTSDKADIKYANLSISNIPIRAKIFSVVNTDDIPENIYTFNIGDEFNVRVKNTNVSIAASLFNSLTTSAINTDSTRVYVNYGAIITSEKYWSQK